MKHTNLLALGALAALVTSCGGAPANTPVVVARESARTASPGAPSAPSTKCDAADRFASSLQSPMLVTAYVTRGTPKLDAFVDALTAVLVRYRAASHGKIELEIVAVDSPGRRADATNAGLVEQVFGEAGGGDVTHLQKGFMGVVLKYRDEQDAIKFLDPSRRDGVEAWLTNRMRDVVIKADHGVRRIGVLGGHDEIGLSEPNLILAERDGPTLRKIFGTNFPQYAFEDVKTTEPAFDAVDALLITQPQKDLSDGDLRRIDQLVMKGKPVAIVASAVNVAAGDASMRATLSAHGLELLTAGYGIAIGRDAVIEMGRPFKVQALTQAGVVTVYSPQIALVTDGDDKALDARFFPFFRLDTLALPFTSSLALDPRRQPGASLRAVARSSAAATLETQSPADLGPFHAWKLTGPRQSHVLAAVAEGKLRSAFGSGQLVEHGRVLVVSSSQGLSNPFVRAARKPEGGDADEQVAALANPYAQAHLTNTILFFKGTLDWLTMPEDLAACTALDL